MSRIIVNGGMIIFHDVEEWALSRQTPTWRIEPIEDAELGGILRNPEDNVIDEIDRLVDWQMGHGRGW